MPLTYELVELETPVRKGKLTFSHAINRLVATTLEHAGARLFYFESAEEAQASYEKLLAIA